MAQILINKVLNNEISLENLQNWILHDDGKITSLRTDSFNTSPEDFISYFLNFIHEKSVSEEKNSEDTPLKCSTPKQKERIISKSFDEDTKNWPQLLPEPQNVLKSPKQFLKSTPTDLKKTPIKATESPYRLEEISCHILNISNPISPLHSYSNGFASPKVKRPLQSPKSCDKVSNICLGDFLVKPKILNKKRSQKKLSDTECGDDHKDQNVKSRRINPTCLSKKLSEIEQTGNCFNFKSNSAEVQVENIIEQRNVLLEERIKILSRTNSNDHFQKLPVKKIQPLQCGEKPEIVAEISNVTFKKQLDKIASIYSFLLQRNYVLNITAELCFLITLLLQKQQEHSENHPMKENFDKPEIIFCNPHNRVYFSAKVLENNIFLFYILDRPSLKLLLDNKNLKNFSHSTHKQIETIYESKVEKPIEVLKADADLNVCFISDTDNRENFASNLSFHAFRKQRDVFYEILRIWETNHLLPNWNFGVALGSKIKYIFNMHPDPTNFMHFCRLFKAQLLKNCVKNGKEVESNENDFSTLSSLSGMTSEKFSLLKSRITTKQFSNGINTTPTFTDHQEFYKEFLIVASNYTFYSHLKDQFISDIIELNDFKFDDYEIANDKTETYSNSSAKKSFIVCLKSLRILAKFLGFLQSFPYKNDAPGNILPAKVLKCQIEIRSQIRPSLNLKSILENSIKNKTLVITVPWVTKYISMLDYVELRLPRFLEVYEILFYIHKSFSLDETVSKTYLFSNANFNLFSVILIKLCLGWLFDLPHFPESLYYEWCFKNGAASKAAQSSIFLNTAVDSFDSLDVVDQNILHICCPYLDEIKKILSSSSNALNSNSRVKHITPVTAVSSSSELMKKKVQYQLEEAFFNGQPASVRKTVEFVSERVASACVKQICYEIVPEFKRKAQEDLKDILLKFVNDNVSENELNAVVRTKINEFSVKKVSELEELIENTVDKQISDRVPVCCDLLLSFDALPQTRKVCGVISCRMCKEKVSEWVKTHITASTFSKDYESVVKGIRGKCEKGTRLDFLPCESHNDNALGPATLLDQIRGFIWGLMDKPQIVTPSAIRDLFGTISTTFRQREDVSKFSYHAVNQMTVDLVLNLVTHVPKLTDKIFITEVVLPFFKNIDNSDDLFENLICPRNVMLLAQSPEGQSSWKCLAVFLSLILKEHLMSLEQFEAQVVALYKNSWDEATLKTLSRFYQDVIDTCSEWGECTEDKFAFLINFLSEYCSDL
ncbi:codanin-1 [Agrilus planipennis]|uniref:Codanin-1 n=1 Tax=Agrilus planipennis TaxID=224129 RepID=A0A1W4WTU9_AGRPL|nr:codanin-1 [Agrilus planipennis]